MHNYLPSQYNAADQNRCIIQDFYGRIFVANNDGILINNGAEWDKLNLPFLCLSLEKDESEQVYVGGDGDFGKIVQGKNGLYVFESFSSLLKGRDKELGKFWTIITLPGHVYFCSNEKIIDYSDKELKVIEAGEEGFHTFFKVGNNLVLRERGVGLKFLSVTGEPQLFREGAQFADNNNPVRGIIKGKKDDYYIVTPNSLYEFQFNKALPELSVIKQFNSPANKWLSEKTVYCAANIGKLNYAFGSVTGGLMITDLSFNPVKYINSTNDLQDDGVNYIYNDVQGHIWLALAKGVSFIEFNSPVTRFTKTDGVKGTVESCIFYNRTPYLATDKGVLKHNSSSLKFEQTNLTETAWFLAEANGRLLAGTRSGLFILENNSFRLVYESPTAVHFIFVHPKNTNLIYLGTENGYAKGILTGNTFSLTSEFNELDADIRAIAITGAGDVCFASTESGIFIEGRNSDTLISITEKEGLPNLKENYIFNYHEKVLVATDNGIYAINKTMQSYTVAPDPAFRLLNNKYIVLRAITIGDEVWCTTKPKEEVRVSKTNEFFICLEPKQNQFEIKPLQLSRIKESNVKSFCYNDSLVYVGTNNGLYCYDVTLPKSGNFLNTFINSFNCGSDSALYYNNINPKTSLGDIILNYNNNSIDIKLGASDFIDKNELQFAYYLKGRDKSYGPYTNNKIVNLDHLHEGDYVFYVKSRNILGVEGQEIKVPFTILPPWYRTIWAYVLYAAIFLFLVYLIIKLNSKRLIEQNIRLENIITDRTREINQQKLEIEYKNREITDSINYAKGIQDSILPGISEIKKMWADLFIFFQPKDIVSGDFYWFKSIDKDEFLIACADCTGHGVPGGFMSMICSDKLHAAANESTEPDKILFMVNNSIKETLRQQNEGKSKDGMEICLLKVNIRTGLVKYSGANRSLWVLKKGSRELMEIKATKASIASFTEFDFNYALHELKLDKGDAVYATSDGYVDQFGGPDGKKYMSKKLKNLLLVNAHQPMPDQEEILKNEINEWMNGFEQVDDLLVIGVRL